MCNARDRVSGSVVLVAEEAEEVEAEVEEAEEVEAEVEEAEEVEAEEAEEAEDTLDSNSRQATQKALACLMSYPTNERPCSYTCRTLSKSIVFSSYNIVSWANRSIQRVGE